MTAPSSICKQPVVAVVGHIDHGKTTLLDAIRKSAVASGETGGITQRISAYEVTRETPDGPRAITFIDTPGHEAFQKMRERGAKAADIAILVVASDDGVKPQTLEAHRAIMEAKIPYIIAFTKIDKDTANLERAKESVMKNNIFLEGLGGDVPFVPVSGKSGNGIPELLDLILLSADLHDIKCDASANAEAVVIESSRNPRSGVSATVIVRRGTLIPKGFAVAHHALAPLRAIEDFTGAKTNLLTCGKPARIGGFTDEPPVGSIVRVFESKKDAERAQSENTLPKPVQKELRAATDKVLVRVILKADTLGSLEAMEYELSKINEERVEVAVVMRGVGPLSENDVKPLIGFEPAVIMGFNVKCEPVAKDLAERQKILLETRDIIYELTDWFKLVLKDLAPEPVGPTISGTAQILKHFSTQGTKHVVGGRVTEGVIKINERVSIIRRGIEVGNGKIVNLQMQKADVGTVPTGMEFGTQIDSKVDVIAGDVISAEHRRP